MVQKTVRHRLFLQTFGVPALLGSDDGTAPSGIPVRRKDLALLVYLCVERKRTHGRALLSSLFWGDASEERARHSLVQAVARLRGVLGADALVFTSDGIEWCGEVCCDATAFNAHRDVVLSNLPSSDFLADFSVGRGGAEFEIWAEGKRSYFRLTIVRLLEEAGAQAEEREAWEDALSLGQRAVNVQPIHEAGHRRIMRAWAQLGERGLALQHYRSFQRWLKMEFEDDPEAETTGLAEKLANPGGPIESRAEINRWVRPTVRPVDAMTYLTAKPGVFGPAAREAPVLERTRRRAVARKSLGPMFVGLLLLISSSIMPLRWLDADEVAVVPADGRPFRVSGETLPRVVHKGTLWRYPDWETFMACSSWRPGIALDLNSVPSMPEPTSMPSVLEQPWLAGYTLVRPLREPDVTYAMVGCVKSVVTENSPATDSRPGVVLAVPDSILELLPTGVPLQTPIRPAGTVLRLKGSGEMRWVLFAGGALVVPSAKTLASHCRSTIADVDSAEFAKYRVVGRLRASKQPCRATDFRG